MIWDLHCHLSGVDGRTPDERIVQLLEYADRMQVERLVFFMGFPWSTDPEPDELRRQNDQVLQAISHWSDRVFAFAYVSAKHVEASLEEIERCVANGPMVGIKLWVAARCADEPVLQRLNRPTGRAPFPSETRSMARRPGSPENHPNKRSATQP